MVNIKFTEDFTPQPARLVVIGVGGGGGNAVNRMIQSKVKNVEFIAANTDAQWLRHHSLAPVRLQLGARLTKGLGAGGDPERGRMAAEESESDLMNHIAGADMVFITAGMGGGTGTGAAPVVAQLAREKGILTVGVVTKPFEFEGRMRAQQAEIGIKNIREHTDTLLIIPNDRLFAVVDKDTPWEECFLIVDDVLRNAVQAISEVITLPQEVNMDFANVKALMTSAGEALMGVGEESGTDRAIKAAQKAMESPLLENVSIEGAKGLLVNICGKRVTMHEIRDAMNHIHSVVAPDAKVFTGIGTEPTLGNAIRITVIAAGFPSQKRPLSQLKTGRRQAIFERSGPISESQRPEELGELKSSGNPLDPSELRKPAYLRRRSTRLN